MIKIFRIVYKRKIRKVRGTPAGYACLPGGGNSTTKWIICKSGGRAPPQKAWLERNDEEITITPKRRI